MASRASVKFDYEKSDMYVQEICDLHGIKRSTFYANFYEHCKPRGSGKRKSKTEEEVKELLKDYFANKMNVRDVAKKHGCAVNTMYRYVKEFRKALKGKKCSS